VALNGIWWECFWWQKSGQAGARLDRALTIGPQVSNLPHHNSAADRRVCKGVCAVLMLAAYPCAAQTEAEKLIEAGHWKRARALVEANRQPSHDALTQFLLSQIHNAFGDRESPLPLAEKAVALDGHVAKYHRQLAEVTGVMAQHAGLLEQFLLARRFRHEIDAALALDPGDVQALRDLMEFYLLAPGLAGGDKDKAQATARRIASVDAVQGFLAQARLAQAAGDPAREEAMLRKAVDAGPSHYCARVTLAEFLLSRGHWEAAREQAEIAVRIDGSRVDAFGLLAAIYARCGRSGDLDAVLATAEKRVPDDFSPYYRAAEALLAAEQDLQRAERYFRRYLAAEPEGNAPSLQDAGRKLDQVLEKVRADRLKGISGTRGTLGPG
jgi:tetratricopeptide (TPR) repeat protein